MKELLNNILAITDNKLIKTFIVILMALLAQLIAKAIIAVIFNNKLGKLRATATNKKHYQRRRLKTIGSLVRAMALFGVWFIAIMVILKIYNIPYAPLLTSAGLIGAGLAFGVQSLVKDLVSGMFIIFENQYRVDDYIELDKVSGRVERVTMRTTAIRDDDGSLHHVPNGSIIITTNLSMGKLYTIQQIDFAREISFKQLKDKIKLISEKIAGDPEYSLVIKEGPHVKSLDSVTKDKMTVSIEFVTTAAKRKQAATILWSLIIKEKLPLA